MSYHIIAFAVGFLLDQVVGDPVWMPHPIRGIGWLIRRREAALRRENDSPATLRRKGRRLCVEVIGLTMLTTAVVVLGAYRIHPVLGCAVEAILTGQALACKCLRVESMKVADALARGDLPHAREAVGWIVGRDTQELDESAVARAAIETVAENTSDGVIAPMLCAALGGPILAFGYKAINTLDSTVGYKNEKYLDFGRCAAKVDDGANFIPSRVSAIGMICAAFLLGKEFSGKNAWKIFRRDRFNHASPNSAQTESVCAGDAKYFGKVVKKPYIGDDLRPVEGKDIDRANRLMYATAWLVAGICLLVMGLAGI